jgi:hypothetical protein
MTWGELWASVAGGIVPVVRRQPREVFVHEGAAYRIELVWLRRSMQLKYTTYRVPRDVRRIREADQVRTSESVRRKLADEPAVQVGDQIPEWAIGYLGECEQVRDCEFTVWKRAVGGERYQREDDGTIDRSQEYDWIAFLAGEWGGGWSTDEGVLNYAPLTVLKVKDHATR